MHVNLNTFIRLLNFRKSKILSMQNIQIILLTKAFVYVPSAYLIFSLHNIFRYLDAAQA